MSLQIFKKQIPTELLFDLLKSICIINNKCYIFNKESFKKGIFTEEISTFIENCKPYYHNSKKQYLEKKNTYNTFTTILRQICNFNKIIYTTQIKYDKSIYNICYYIFF
jgi:hypothetical protein